MSKISDMYEQIKLQQYTLIKTKLQEAVKASKERRELSEEERKDYTFTDDEVTILMKLLEEQGLENGKDFENFVESDYDAPDYSLFTMKIDGEYIVISTDTWGGHDIPTITDIEDIREKLSRGFKSHDLEEAMQGIVNLSDVDLEQIQIGTQARENRVREKLKETIKDMMTGNEQSKDNSLYRDNEIYILLDMLKKAGLEEGKDFCFEEEPFEYDETVPELHIRIGDTILHFSGMSSITDIISIQELEEEVNEDPEHYQAKLLKLEPFELEKIGISRDSIQMPEETIGDDYENDDNDYEYDDDYDIEPDDYDVIYNILRNRIPDYNANAMFRESTNFCEIGQYSDMPGEEQIAIILNSMDRETLKEYFEQNPEDLALFEQMRGKYADIEPLDEEIQKTKDARQLFEESLLRDDVVEYYLSKTPSELETELGPEVAKMVGFEQKNSHHCYDLWEHTLRTVEGIKANGLTPEQFKKLRIAAFFHDVGKPDVSKFNEQTGQQVFYGHAMHSVDVASPILERLGYSEQEIAQLGFFIGHHDDFISYKSKLAPFMKNHEFIRGIDSATVAEKVIENKFDFEAMGYDKDQVRAICYTLAHDQKPDFRVKNQPIVIDVNMDEVQSRMDSGKYDASYDASLEDYQMLLQLCKADAGAQSEVAMQKGKVVGSKAEKLENMENIETSLPEAYRDAVAKTGYTFEQFIKDTKQVAFGEKRPEITCKDGYSISVQASSNHYCSPRKDGLTEYNEYEANGITEAQIAQLEEWAENPNEKHPIYGFVPKEEIKQLLLEHGGLDKAIMKARVKERQEVFKPKDTELERQIQELSGGNEFLANILRYATRKVEVREQNAQAAQLAQDYEQQIPKEQQSLDDE